MNTEPLRISPQTARLNILVERFDRATGFAYDRVTDPLLLAEIATHDLRVPLALAHALRVELFPLTPPAVSDNLIRP